MRFKITEPTFFLHKERQPGEIMEAPMGPYRNVATGGGLQRIPQFEEIKDEMQNPFKETPVSVTGIQSGAFEAKLTDMRKKLADRLTKGLSKIDTAAEAGASKMDAAVDSVVAKVDKEIEDKLQEFATMTNGGPA